MHAFLALVRKDLLLYISDRRALIVSLLLPVVTASFFGYLFGGTPGGKTSPIDIAVVQQDDSAVSARIVKGLQSDAALSVRVLDFDAAQAEVRKGHIKAAAVLPKGFGEQAGRALFGAGDKPAITMLYDPSQQAVLSMVKGMLTQQVMSSVSEAMFAGPEGERFTNQALAAAEQQPASERNATLVAMLSSVQAWQNQKPAGGSGGGGTMLGTPFSTSDQAVMGEGMRNGYNAYAHSFAGMGVQFVLFLAVDIGIGILLVRRNGIWQRMLAAPIGMRTILLSRTLSTTLIATGVMTVCFAFSVFVFKVQISNPLGLLGVVICFALLTSSFGLLVAAFGKTPDAARGMAIFATLIMVMLGGAWVPSFVFPAWIQQVSLVMPTRWAIDGMDAMTWRALGWDAAFLSMGAQLCFAAVFLALALWRFGVQHRRGEL